MNYRAAIYIVLLCAFSFVACKRGKSDMKRVTELEQQALLSSPRTADSLLKIADSLYTDSIRSAVREAIRARNLSVEEKYDLSFLILKKVEDFCRRQSPSERIYNILSYTENCKGVNWIYTSSPMSSFQDSAIQAFKNSAYYSRLMGDVRRLPLIYYNIAGIYEGRNNYALSAYYGNKALLTADSLKMPFSKTYFLYLTLGNNYKNLDDYKRAMQMYDKVLRILSVVTPEDRVYLYLCYSSLYLKLEDYSKALLYSKKAIEKAQKSSVAQHFSYYQALKFYAIVLAETGNNPARAEALLKKVLHYYRQVKDEDQIWSVRIALLNLAVKNRDVSAAGKNVEDMKKEGTDINKLSADRRKDWYKALEGYYRLKKSYESAYNYNRKATVIEDSIKGYRQQQYVANLALEYQLDTTLLHHRIFIAQQEAEIKSLHWRYVAVVLVGVVIVLLFVGYYVYARRRRTQMYNRYMANINRLKMQNIRNCISPHFTFNVLNHEIELNSESKEKYNRLVDLTHLLRKSLDSGSSMTVTLADELDFVAAYVRLLNECGKKFSYTLTMDKAVDTSKVMIPSMILQIPVENAVKHGFTTKDGNYKLNMAIRHTGSGTEIEIENNGQPYSPFSKVRKDNSIGIGMQVIYQSLLMLNMKNKNKIVFNISPVKQENESETCVKVYIPDGFDYSCFSS